MRLLQKSEITLRQAQGERRLSWNHLTFSVRGELVEPQMILLQQAPMQPIYLLKILLAAMSMLILLACCEPLSTKVVMREIVAGETVEKEIVKKEVIEKRIVKKVEKEKCSHRDFLLSLANGGDFDEALRKNQETLERFPVNPPGDEALFNLGLIHAHPENPQKDYGMARIYFQRLITEFPGSQLVAEAQVWIGVLTDIESTTRVDVEIEEMKKGFSN